MSIRNAAWLIVLSTAALGSWYLAGTGDDSGPPAAVAEAPYRGYYLESARILGTGPSGDLLYEILADRAEQRAGEAIEFTDVRIRYSPATEVPWTVDADTATIQPELERVLLRGHVRAFSEAGFAGNDTEIRTQYLELDPKGYLAETDARVQVRIGARSLIATGMLASLKDDRLKLKSNVRGKFAP